MTASVPVTSNIHVTEHSITYSNPSEHQGKYFAQEVNYGRLHFFVHHAHLSNAELTKWACERLRDRVKINLTSSQGNL